MGTTKSVLHILVFSLLFLCKNTLANTRTCFTQLQFIHGVYPTVTYADIANDEHSGFNINCEEAEILCFNYMLSHVQGILGVGVAYIRGAAGTELCNMIGREIYPDNPTHVYVNWVVSNCGKTGRLYLGQICCWRYYVGSQAVLVHNPECSQCQKPNCTEHPQGNPQTPVTARPVTAVPLVVDPSDPNAVSNLQGVRSAMDQEKEEVVNFRPGRNAMRDEKEQRVPLSPYMERYYLDKGKPSVNMDQNDRASAIKDKREKYLQPENVEFVEKF